MTTARVRIGRVTLKRGGRIELLREPANADRGAIEAHLRETIDAHGQDFAGYAVVFWSSDGGSTADLRLGSNSKIPSILVPDFVRNRLLALQVERWTIDSVNNAWGFPQ